MMAVNINTRLSPCSTYQPDCSSTISDEHKTYVNNTALSKHCHPDEYEKESRSATAVRRSSDSKKDRYK